MDIAKTNDLPPLREVIKMFDLAAKKSLGQNFLLDMNLIKKIVKSAGDISNATVLEIGPGPGGLTRALLELGAKKVIVVEKDQRMLGALNQIKQVYQDRLEIINADALELDGKFFLNSNNKIVANLPYNIASVLLFKWLDQIELFQSMTLMFQKEVAMRIVAKPSSKQYGRMSVMSQFSCEVNIEFDINPNAFIPAPKVYSSVVNFKPKNTVTNIDKDKLSMICKALFNQRRKYLSSSLKQISNKVEQILSLALITPTKRPEELSQEEFQKLCWAYQQFH